MGHASRLILRLTLFRCLEDAKVRFAVEDQFDVAKMRPYLSPVSQLAEQRTYDHDPSAEKWGSYTSDVPRSTRDQWQVEVKYQLSFSNLNFYFLYFDSITRNFR